MDSEKMVMLVLLTNNTFLICEVEEVVADLGQPDCKLMNPYIIDGDDMQPWMTDYTKTKELMISSDKILTIFEPKKTILDKYLELTQ
jgi:hypothetical protein